MSSGRLTPVDLPRHLIKWVVPAMKMMREKGPDRPPYAPFNVIPDSRIIASIGPMATKHEDHKEGPEESVEFLLRTVVNESHPVSHIYVVADDTFNYAIRESKETSAKHHRYGLEITQETNQDAKEIKTRGFAEASLKIVRPDKNHSHCRATVFDPSWMKTLVDDKSPAQESLQDKILQAYHESYRDNQFILIHCQLGISRTAHLAFILVLMKYFADNPQDAITLSDEMAKGPAGDMKALNPALVVYNKMRKVRPFDINGQEFIMCIHHATTLHALRLKHEAKATVTPAAVAATKNPASVMTLSSPSTLFAGAASSVSLPAAAVTEPTVPAAQTSARPSPTVATSTN